MPPTKRINSKKNHTQNSTKKNNSKTPNTTTLTFEPLPKKLPYPLLAFAYKKNKAVTLSETAIKADKESDGAVMRAIKEADFKAQVGNSIIVRASKGTVIIIGAGDGASDEGASKGGGRDGGGRDGGPRGPLAGKQSEDLGGHIASAIARSEISQATLCIDNSDATVVSDIALGFRLASYNFNRYFTKGAKATPPRRKLIIASPLGKTASRAFKPAEELAQGVFLARDLVFEPANVLHPAHFAERCKGLSACGLKVKILDEKAMKKEGMNLLLSVGQGSTKASRMVIMHWDGGRKGEKPLALVGKGVCFDSGGISIKPAGGMEDMKWDMGGAAAVTGAMRAIAGRKLKRNVVGLIGLVENMPDGDASRPGDVVRSMSGQTVEIINTDAEGRLVLADVLTYTLRHFKPAKMVNLATLTGAIIVALGKGHAGLFSNNDALADAIMSAGAQTGEKAWRLPLGDEYDALLKSHIADMKNIGGRWAGSITAACFLERFVGNTPWAHIDIAGMAWSEKSKPTVPVGGTGYGVRLLTRLIENGV